jgi:hypothetical protein
MAKVSKAGSRAVSAMFAFLQYGAEAGANLSGALRSYGRGRFVSADSNAIMAEAKAQKRLNKYVEKNGMDAGSLRKVEKAPF